MFSNEELVAIATFLNRTNIAGKEAATMTFLLQKIAATIKAQTPTESDIKKPEAEKREN